MDSQKAYQLGWDRSKYWDDSIEGFEKSRARFIAKYGDTFIASWEEGWADAGGREVGEG